MTGIQVYCHEIVGLWILDGKRKMIKERSAYERGAREVRQRCSPKPRLP